MSEPAKQASRTETRTRETMKLHELAAAIDGEAAGDREVEIVGVAEIATAGPGKIVMAADSRRLAEAEGSAASAVLLPENLSTERKPFVRAKNIRLAFARAIGILHPQRPPAPGIHPTATVGEGTRVSRSASIGPHAVIGEGCEILGQVVIGAACVIGDGVRIGEDSILYPHVTVYARCIIGARVILHGGAVVGSDGFGYASVNGRQVKIPHVGRVVVEDDVEIGANSAIDRATLGETRIGAGTKIDNLVQIGHNVVIGRDVVIAGQCGISGSVTIGDRAVLAGKVGVVDHAIIGEGAIVLAGAAVRKDVPAGAVMWGIPARPHREELEIQATLGRLPDLVKRMAKLERRRSKGENG